MKKIVLTIIALVCFINVNAQRVEMNYENTFQPIFEVRNISARGTANITLNYSDVIVSINCTGFTEFSNKGVVIDNNHNCLEFVGDIEEQGAATFTVSLSDNAKQANKYIKKITFITRGNSDITSVIGSNDAGSDTDVKFVGTNRIVVEDGYSAISTFEIDFTYSDYVQLKSIMVEYGYFDDELTLTDDSYDYFGDYRYAKKVTYTRPMNSEKWGSLCLPFNYVVDDSKFSVYTIKGAGLNGSNAPITLSKVANGTEVVAGTPMFVYCTKPNLVVSAENVLVTTEDFNSSGLIYEYGTTEALKDGNENLISPSLNYTFYGTIKTVTVTDAIFVEKDIFKYINGTAKTFQPYRAYFTLEGNNSGTGSLTFRVLNGSNLTSVAGVCGAEGHETDVKWELTDMDNNGSLETLTISGTGDMANYDSSSDHPWSAFHSDITTAVIGDGVTSIGRRAFADCANLTSVTLPAGVEELGDDAFEGYNANLIIYVPLDEYENYCNSWPAYADIIQIGAIPYIAADGTKQYCAEFIELTGSETSLAAGTYLVASDISYTGTVTLTGNVTLILADNCHMNVGTSGERINGYGIYGEDLETGNDYDLTITSQSLGTSMGALSVYTTGAYKRGIRPGALTINGGNITADSDGEWAHALTAFNDLTINGGTVRANATGSSADAIFSNGNFHYNGGTVTATATYDKAIFVFGKHYTFNWRNPGDRITIGSTGLYAPDDATATFARLFTDATNIYSGELTGSALNALAGKTLSPAYDITLLDNADNSATIGADYLDGVTQFVTLQGRTLYKDGKWNTICLPFDVTISGSALDGAIVKKFDATTSNLSSDGTLTLNFVAETTKLTAGTPYLIRWTSGDHLVNPVFTDVTIDADASTSVNFDGGAFVGTYSPVNFEANDKSILFLGGENKLYWPNADMTLGACRAYFDLGTNEARKCVLNFNDDEDNTTGIAPLLSPEGDDAGASPRGGLVGASWYDLQGRRLSQKPTKAGIYVRNGRKKVVK